MSPKEPDKSQSDKFKDLAREVEMDEDEEVFDAKLRKMRERKPVAVGKNNDR